MQVVTVETSAGQTRYYLANDDGSPVEPVLRYLTVLVEKMRFYYLKLRGRNTEE